MYTPILNSIFDNEASSMKTQFLALPEVILTQTGQILSNADLIKLATLSRKNWSFFNPMILVRKLLLHVVRGEHEAVQAMLKKDISLISKRGSVVDCSGRIFEMISPFQYALWALDKHM